MKFKRKGHPFNDEGMDQICSTLGVAEAEIWAVLTVETRGFGFFHDRSPQILFERHKFHHYTDGVHDAGNGDISHAIHGGYTHGSSEYKRLRKAAKLDNSAALQSASWGIAQVMGFNYKVAGFNSVESMVKNMVKNENEQLLAMANFIKGNGLEKALQRNNWASFARGYNGGDFKQNEYDTRLAAAHARYMILLPDLSLRSAQAALSYLGINPGPVDGIRGRLTHSALIEFQQRSNLTETGELDRYTEEKLIEAAY